MTIAAVLNEEQAGSRAAPARMCPDSTDGFRNFAPIGARTAQRLPAKPLDLRERVHGGANRCPIRLQEEDEALSLMGLNPGTRKPGTVAVRSQMPESKNGYRSVRAEVPSHLLCVGRPVDLTEGSRVRARPERAANAG